MNNRIALIWANHVKMTEGQQMRLHSHTCCQLYYILSGSPHFIIDGQPLQAKPGSFFLIPAGAKHQALPYGKDGCESYELKVVLNDPFFREHLNVLRPPLEDTGMIRDTLSYIVKCWKGQDSQHLDNIESLLSSLLLQLFLKDIRCEENGSRYIKADRYNQITRDIMAYIDNNYTNKFSLPDLGSALGYNKNYLSTTFSKSTGFSIIDYLNFVRIRRALHCFAFYGQDVFTTYESSGFSCPSYFSRAFKSMVGISPRSFRQAFSSETEACFTQEPILNFHPCTMEEGLRSMQNIGKIALACLDEKKK